MSFIRAFFLLSALWHMGLVQAKVEEVNLLSFDSDKEWVAGRWYLVGRWLSANTIKWLNGAQQSVAWNERRCRKTPFIPKFESRSNQSGNLEVLRSGPWFAIEVNPVITEEIFDLQVRKPSDAAYCHEKLTLKISLTASNDMPRPVLVLKPKGSRYYGKNIEISVLNLEERSNVDVETELAYWRISLPNRQALGAASSLHLFPVALGAVEWFWGSGANFGTRIFLEQSSSYFGAKAQQSLLYSSWGAGIFSQFYLRVLKGLQIRAQADYSQVHLEDGRVVRSVDSGSFEAQYYSLGLGSVLYFGERWSVGVDGKYGFPNQMAGRGVDQKSYQGNFRMNFQASESVTVLSSFGMRAYQSGNAKAESIQTLSLGVRLGL